MIDLKDVITLPKLKRVTDKLKLILGNSDISAIGDGTITGGISELNSNFKIGTSGIWKYKKSADGTIELWGQLTFNIPMYSSNVPATAYNTIIFDAVSAEFANSARFPFTLKGVPRIFASPAPGSGDRMFILGTDADATRLKNVSYARYNTNTTNAFSAKIDFYVIGEID